MTTTVTAERKNVSSSLVNFTVVAVAGLFVNPLLVAAIGSPAFGVWKSCQRFVDFASVADGRAVQALKWVIAHSTGDGEHSRNRRSMTASILIWAASLPILLAASVGLMIYVPRLLTGVEDVGVGATRQLVLFLCLNIALAGFLMIPDSALLGSNRGYQSMTITTICFVITSVGLVVVARSGLGVAYLGLVTLSGAVLNGFLTYLRARRSLTWWGFDRPDRSEIIGIGKFSGWSLTWSLLSRVMLASEVILIGYLIGVTSVTTYTFTSYVAQFGLSVCLLITSAAMPRLGRLLGEQDLASASALIRRVREQTLALGTILSCLILLVNESFIDVWVGADQFMGGAANTWIALCLFQLVVLRNESQVQDTGLNIGRKVLVGALSIGVALLMGVLAFLELRTAASIFAGLFAGRMIATVFFARLVDGMTLATSRIHWRQWIAAGGILFLCWLASNYVEVTDPALLVLLFLGACALVGAYVYVTILSASTKSDLNSLAGRRR